MYLILLQLTPLFFIQNTNFNLSNLFKFLSKINPFIKLTTLNKSKTYNTIYKYQNTLHKSFYIFIKLSLSSQKLTLKPHHSFKSFFVKNKLNGSSLILNISKIRNKYFTFFSLILNMYFYKLPMLIFGHVFFKSEILSINWVHLSKFIYKLRLNDIILFITPFKRSQHLIKIFKLIKKSILKYAFIIDTTYHATTIEYLNKLSVLTIGPIPIIYNSKDLDITLPITTDNIFLQHFFLKLILSIKKYTEYKNYNLVLNLWRRHKTKYL